MATITVVATQGAIKHFRQMVRLRCVLTGGSTTEQISIPNFDLSPTDYVRVIPDPNSAVMAAGIIEQLSSRTTTQIILASSDGVTNIPGGLQVEIVIIKRQLGDGNTTLVNAGNGEDSLFGPGVESGRFDGSFTASQVQIPSQLITADSQVWIDQKKTNTGTVSGLVESYTVRSSGASFVAIPADTNDSPTGGITIDWIVFPR